MKKYFIRGLLALARSLANGDAAKGRRFKLLVRFAVTVGIFTLLFWFLPVETLISAIASIPPTIWLLVVGLVLVLHSISALKWRLLLGATGTPITAMRAVRAHGAGMFATIFLPGNVGGDFVRAALIVREKKGKLESIAVGSFADRINDMLALILISFVASIFLPEIDHALAGNILEGVAFLLFVGIVTIIVSVRLIPPSRLPNKLAKIVIKFGEAIDSLFSRPLIALSGLCLSLLIQCGFIGLNIIFAKTMGLDVPIVLWFFAWPLTKLAALAPISLGGLGVRNVVLASLMLPFGADTNLVVAQSLCWDAVMIFTGLAGIAAAMLPASLGDQVPSNAQ